MVKTATHPRYIPGEHCGKEEAWAYDKGICLQPVGHEKKCRFVWAEGVEGLGGEQLSGISG